MMIWIRWIFLGWGGGYIGSQLIKGRQTPIDIWYQAVEEIKEI